MSENNSQSVWMGLSFLAVGLMAGVIFTGVSGEGGFANLLRGESEVEEVDNTPDVDPEELETVVVSTDDDPIMGDPEAPVTIVEFSDYQCPYCQAFWKETLPLIKEKYIDTGKVKLVYRDYPLPSHTEADEAAKAAECVRDQGALAADEAYYAMHDALFLNRSVWSGQADPTDAIVALAEDLDYDGERLRTCMASAEAQDELNADFTAGKSYGVSGTPTFFINGKKLVGAWPYEVFEKVIESEL